MKAKRISTFCWVSTWIIAAMVTVTLGQRTAAADSDPSSRVARLNYLRGSVSFQPAGEPEWVSAIVNRPVTTGDRLWADENSRAEMHLGSATIRLDEQTGMSFLNLDDRTTQIELSEGVLNIRVLRLDRDEIFEIDTPNQAFSIERPGQYRIDASEDGHTTMVTVRSGEGEVTGGGRTYTVGTGVTGSFVGDDLLHANIYKSGGYDDFDQWCQDRDRRDDGAKSVRYVSREVVGYQDLDDYGYWQNVPGYGFVWFPRVSIGWAPYHDGHWAWISPWGWTWIDDAPWGYAPFHYGRWVAVRNTWAWIPGPVTVRPVYAPALVAFVGGPHFSISVSIGGGGGNVAWFPLGPREVYVPSYHTSREYVERVNVSNTTVNNITITNVYNNTNNTNIHYVNKTVNGGVTAVSQTTFINAQHVGKSAVVVNQRDIETAPVSRRAEVAPSRNSVLGPGASEGKHVPQPRAEVINRAVVAKTPPPAAPVPFERQQAKFAAQPGQPLASKDIESLRPSNAAPGRTHVRQAPLGKPTVADSMQAPSTPPINRHSSDKGGPSTAANNEPEGHNGNRGQMSSQSQTVAPAAPPTVVTPSGENSQSRNNNRPPSANRGQSPNAPAQTVAPTAPPTVVTPSGENSQSRNNNRPPSANRGQSPNAPAQTVAPATPPTVVTPSGETSQPRNSNRPPSANRGQSSNAPAQTVAPAAPPTVVTPSGETRSRGTAIGHRVPIADSPRTLPHRRSLRQRRRRWSRRPEKLRSRGTAIGRRASTADSPRMLPHKQWLRPRRQSQAHLHRKALLEEAIVTRRPAPLLHRRNRTQIHHRVILRRLGKGIVAGNRHPRRRRHSRHSPRWQVQRQATHSRVKAKTRTVG